MHLKDTKIHYPLPVNLCPYYRSVRMILAVLPDKKTDLLNGVIIFAYFYLVPGGVGWTGASRMLTGLMGVLSGNVPHKKKTN